MTEAFMERGLALIGAVVVGTVASIQLKNDWPAQGLDATVTKILLGLMVLGCVLALLAALRLLGAHAA
jgi:hypothetical protein